MWLAFLKHIFQACSLCRPAVYVGLQVGLKRKCVTRTQNFHISSGPCQLDYNIFEYFFRLRRKKKLLGGRRPRSQTPSGMQATGELSNKNSFTVHCQSLPCLWQCTVIFALALTVHCQSLPCLWQCTVNLCPVSNSVQSTHLWPFQDSAQ